VAARGAIFKTHKDGRPCQYLGQQTLPQPDETWFPGVVPIMSKQHQRQWLSANPPTAETRMPTSTAVPARFSFSAIGAGWEILTEEPIGQHLREAVLARVETYDRTYSRFRPDSLVAAMATAPRGGDFVFPPDAIPLFDLYDRLYAATDGAVDPLVGRDLERLGYDAGYTLRPLREDVRAAERVDRASWAVDVDRKGRTLRTVRPVVVDVGAAGKGQLVDLLTALLAEAGFDRCTVDASGDLRHRGDDALRVGLEHPTEPGRVIGIARLRDQALCASATNRRAWGDGLHHVIDPRTGTPERSVLATWAIADQAMLADGLATALFFTPGTALRRSFHFTWAQMLANHTVRSSSDLDGELFTQPSQADTFRTVKETS